MWTKSIFIVVVILLLNDRFVVQTIPDDEFEQVIADRYLFSPYANDSTWWPVLTNVRNAWQVVSLPEYHSQSSEGFWLLIESIQQDPLYQLGYMSVIDNGSSLIILSDINVESNGSFLVVSNDPSRQNDYTAALISPKDIKLILCNRTDVRSCRIQRTIPLPSSITEQTKTITSGMFISDLDSSGSLYIGCDSGLHALDLATFQIIPFVNEINVSISSLAWSRKHQSVFVGSEKKLWIEIYRNGTNIWRFEHIYGLIDKAITSLVYDDVNDRLWIGQITGLTYLSPVIMSTGRLHWYFTRLDGQIASPGSYIGHLPLDNITALSMTNGNPSDGCVWLGSLYGLARYNGNSSENNAWRVFNSARYMPNRFSEVQISSLTVLNRKKSSSIRSGNTAVGITNRGLSVLRFEMWTLEKKAQVYQAMIDQSDRHVRYNLVSDCTMSKWGDPTTCVKGPNDNDGLWTSMYLGSQAFRYAVTNETIAKKNAWKFFQGLYSLNHVTGILGYPSRSIAKIDEFPPTPDWYPSPVNSSLQFKGDTSSDEMVGHQFIYPLVHDFLCDDDAQRALVLAVLINQTTHILTHNWYLIGEKGNHTTWGIWNPNEINNTPFYQESRGLNSLQILAFLFQAYAYTADEQFLTGIHLLIDSYGYDINLINEKMLAVNDTNFSDDELAYLAYFNLAYAFHTVHRSTILSSEQKESAQPLIDYLREYMIIGLNLAQRYKQMEKSPFYNFIYCYVAKENSAFDCQSLAKDGIWYMQRFPLELINWPQFNSLRLDVQINEPAQYIANNRYSLQLLPPDERLIHKWNDGVFDLDDGDGFNEDDPTIFLLSYWGMRFIHLLES